MRLMSVPILTIARNFMGVAQLLEKQIGFV
jgi:hypothetical protein